MKEANLQGRDVLNNEALTEITKMREQLEKFNEMANENVAISFEDFEKNMLPAIVSPFGDGDSFRNYISLTGNAHKGIDVVKVNEKGFTEVIGTMPPLLSIHLESANSKLAKEFSGFYEASNLLEASLNPADKALARKQFFDIKKEYSGSEEAIKEQWRTFLKLFNVDYDALMYAKAKAFKTIKSDSELDVSKPEIDNEEKPNNPSFGEEEEFEL